MGNDSDLWKEDGRLSKLLASPPILFNNDVREETPDYVYVKRQQLKALHPTPGVGGVLDVRASGNAKLLAGPLRDLIRTFDSSATITSIKTLREQIDVSLHPDRLIAALCSIFSLLALILTCIGLYGTLSFGVAQRTNEIGVRMALGARPGNIFGLVIGQGMRLVIVGLVIGAAGALASESLLTETIIWSEGRGSGYVSGRVGRVDRGGDCGLLFAGAEGDAGGSDGGAAG